MSDGLLKVELLHVTPDAEKFIERIGRKCYNSEHGITGNSHGKFISNLIEKKHDSVLEHCVATFDISGISRACSHQLVRHRIASYTQKSQRYCPEDNFEFIIPEKILNNEKALIAYLKAMTEINRAYTEMRVVLGTVKCEDARMVLPNACTTSITVTMNFRSLRNFFKLRCAKDAQWEIRAMAMEMLRLVMPHAPHVFQDLWRKFNDEN